MPAAKPIPERNFVVFMEDRTVMLTVPEGCKVTFGPWSPPNMQRSGGMYDRGPTPQQMRGTLRVYQGSKENIIALLTGVLAFYEAEMDVTEIEAGMLTMAHLGPRSSSDDKKAGRLYPTMKGIHSKDEVPF